MFDITYARQRYEDYLIWESERTNLRLDLISKNKYKSNLGGQSTQSNVKKIDSVAKFNTDTGDIEHITLNETAMLTISTNPLLPNTRSHHSQHHPLPTTIPTVIKGKSSEPQPTQQIPIDVIVNASDSSSNLSNVKKRTGTGAMPDMPFASPLTPPRRASRFALFAQRFRDRAKTRLKSYYMYYSLNNLFDWIVYILCTISIVTHAFDISSHTVFRARMHMYMASITVICLWFRFMVFFRTIIISAKTLRSKIVEIKLGELVIMVSLDKKNKKKWARPHQLRTTKPWPLENTQNRHHFSAASRPSTHR
jgi:hypothetical protein